MNTTEPSFPSSIAIAGAWGYIGRKFLDAALARGLTVYVYDPGPAPADVDHSRLTRLADEASFYAADADLFHLATHPEHRRLDLLIGRDVPPLVLNEKPMAEPERPETCRAVVDAVTGSRAVVLYDFPELFDPLTARVVDHLRGFREVRLTELYVQRSKDREDTANPRNRKRIVPVQFQESVHCLAWALDLLAAVAGGVGPVLAGGVTVSGESRPYAPPNPEDYPYVVDGRCQFRLTLGGVRVEGLTDFTRDAPWVKRRGIRGVGDGRPFEIEVSYLEGQKSLRIDGVGQAVDPLANSYAQVISTAWKWSRAVDRETLMTGLYPNPRFTQVTYQLSSALWRSCRDRRELTFPTRESLLAFDAGFASEVASFGKYEISSGPRFDEP